MRRLIIKAVADRTHLSQSQGAAAAFARALARSEDQPVTRSSS